MKNKIIVHCSDSPNFKDLSVDAIDKMHKARGWRKIGYHFVIQPTGQVDVGRAISEVGAHTEGENSTSVGVCLIGRDRFTKAQFTALKELCNNLEKDAQIPRWAIYGHYEFKSAQKQGKTCPNIDKARLLAWILTGDETPLSIYME